MKKRMFFPDYLDESSTGVGVWEAVTLLQLLLLMGRYNRAIIPDGNFGEETKKGVILLQKDLGCEMDGKFGPSTRARLLEQRNLDINKIPADAFMVVIPDDEPVVANAS